MFCTLTINKVINYKCENSRVFMIWLWRYSSQGFSLQDQTVNQNLDIYTVRVVEFYYICPRNAQYIVTISVSSSCSTWDSLGIWRCKEGENSFQIAQRGCVLHYNKALGLTALSFQEILTKTTWCWFPSTPLHDLELQDFFLSPYMKFAWIKVEWQAMLYRIAKVESQRYFQ